MRPSYLVRAGGVALAVAAAFGVATSITQADSAQEAQGTGVPGRYEFPEAIAALQASSEPRS